MKGASNVTHPNVTHPRADRDAVANLIRDVAAVEILPRFRNLKEGDTRQKSPGDFVTIADESAELALTPGLLKILPGSVVVGEEAEAYNDAER